MTPSPTVGFDSWCSSGCHMIHGEWHPDPDDQDPLLYLGMWEPRQAGPGWRHRLRLIWRVLRTGYPFLDDVVLNRSEVLKLVEELDTFIARTAPKEPRHLPPFPQPVDPLLNPSVEPTINLLEGGT